MIHKGSCHCKAVEFEIEAPDKITVQECNCSICSMTGFIHLIVPKSKFRLIKGKDNLVTYSFNTGVAKHLFCKTCGIKAFYVPRSNPDGYSVNLRCLDKTGFKEIITEQFDGQNWEETADILQHLSKD